MLRYEIMADPDAQYMGLRFRESLDPHTVLVFPHCTGGMTFDSQNVKFSFSIMALDDNDVVIKCGIVHPQEELFNTPLGTCTVIEGTEDFISRNNVRVGEKFPYDGQKGG